MTCYHAQSATILTGKAKTAGNMPCDAVAKLIPMFGGNPGRSAINPLAIFLSSEPRLAI